MINYSKKLIKYISIATIIISFAFTQCEQLSKFPCISTLGCDWISQVKEGPCLELNQSECRSGKYQGCYWEFGFNQESK